MPPNVMTKIASHVDNVATLSGMKQLNKQNKSNIKYNERAIEQHFLKRGKKFLSTWTLWSSEKQRHIRTRALNHVYHPVTATLNIDFDRIIESLKRMDETYDIDCEISEHNKITIEKDSFRVLLYRTTVSFNFSLIVTPKDFEIYARRLRHEEDLADEGIDDIAGFLGSVLIFTDIVSKRKDLEEGRFRFMRKLTAYEMKHLKRFAKLFGFDHVEEIERPDGVRYRIGRDPGTSRRA